MSKNFRFPVQRRIASHDYTSFAALIFLLVVGCTVGCAGNEGGEVEGNGYPAYALTSNVWGTDGATGYLFTVPSLEEGTADLDTAIELPGGAWMTGSDEDSFVYVSSGEGGPTITRWEVLENGQLREGPTISFAGLGVTSGIRFGTAPILSETKGYLLDADNHLIATWNPQAMEVGRVIELDVEERDGIPGRLSAITARDDRVFVTVVWEQEWKWRNSARVIVIDPLNDEIITSSDDTRCEELTVTSSDSTGTAYFGPHAFAASARAVLGSEFGTASCALRIVPPGASFDEGWEADLSALAGGRAAGEFILASDEVAFFRAFYADEVDATPETWDEVLGAPAYRWWRWQIGANEAEEIPGQKLTLEASHYYVDGKAYVGNPSADFASTTIVKLDPSGELRDGLTLRGTPGGVVRVH